MAASALDVAYVRDWFPALDTSWALFDNAGGSVPTRPVIERLTDYMSRYQVQLGASYATSAEAARRVAVGRRAAARLVNADVGEVVLGPSSTMLLGLLARALGATWSPGDEVIVTNLDHESNIGPWRALEAAGVVVREWRFRPETLALHVEDLDVLLGPRTRLVAFTHCSNLIGTIHDVPAITARVRAAGALSCVDGVAYAPHRRVDVQALGADFYAVSLYKTYGPHLGLLYGRREALLAARSQNHLFVGEDEVPYKLEPGNVTHELAASLPGILDYLDAVDAHHGAGDTKAGDAADPLARTFARFARHEAELVAPLLAFLVERDGVRLLGSPESDSRVRVPTVSFVVDDLPSSAVPPLLDRHEVAVRYGHFYAFRAARDLGLLERDGVVRASLVHYNTPAEVERLIGGLDEVLP